MEQWPKSSILPLQLEAEKHHHQRPVRVLGDTSGNVQTYPQELKPGIENHISSYNAPNLKILSPVGGQYHFPPVPTLPSNDQNAANLARLHARRQRKDHSHSLRRRFDEVRPYLLCNKYIEYRARRRQDTGHDGKPVWDDPMEEAFQNGIFWYKFCQLRLTLTSTGGYQTYGQKEEVSEWQTKRP